MTEFIITDAQRTNITSRLTRIRNDSNYLQTILNGLPENTPPPPPPPPAPTAYPVLSGVQTTFPYAGIVPGVMDLGGQDHEAAWNDAAQHLPAGKLSWQYADVKGRGRREFVTGGPRGHAELIRMASADSAGIGSIPIGPMPTGTIDKYLQWGSSSRVGSSYTRFGWVEHYSVPPARGPEQNKLPCGLFAWDRDWANFPGGNQNNGWNASVRVVHHGTNFDNDLRVYLYTGPGGSVGSVNGAAYNGHYRPITGGKNFDIGTGVTLELGRMYDILVVADIGTPGNANGWLELYLDGTRVLMLTSVRWTDAARPTNTNAPGQGWNGSFLPNMIGGSNRTVDVPTNPQKSTWVRVEAQDTYARDVSTELGLNP